MVARDGVPSINAFLARLQWLAPEPRWWRLWGKQTVFSTVSSLDAFWEEGFEAVKAELLRAGETTEGFPELFAMIQALVATAALVEKRAGKCRHGPAGCGCPRGDSIGEGDAG